jgi:hypothetical protein
MGVMCVSKTPIYTMDIETDPFKHGRMPEPFCVGFYDGHTFVNFWGDDCIAQAWEYVRRQPVGIIFMHNGGRFDVFYLIRAGWLQPFEGHSLEEANMMIINGRIVRAEMHCVDGKHEIRDSYAILPFPLRDYNKDEIDYNKMERENREENRAEIVSYLCGDCRYLWELVSGFVESFGKKLTVGSASMAELQKVHSFTLLDAAQDRSVRENYYHGGRVECYKRGVVKGNFRVYDVNSMYPFVMRTFKHPIGAPVFYGKKITPQTCFVSVEGKNYGAFPSREKNGLRFDRESGIFHVTIHEWETAIRYGLFVPQRILQTIDFDNQGTFSEFVNKFYSLRVRAKAENDSIHSLYYKYILNSSYGKFGQNPENYFDYQITLSSVCLAETWEPAYFPNEDYIIWRRKSNEYRFYNVATAASITGAARAVLMEAIANATGILYCDTDSLICETLSGVAFDESELGAWKKEANITKACIAGKKLYALFDITGCVKQANKGVKLTAEEIERLCEGEEIESKRDAPSFKVGSLVSDAMIPGKIQHTFVTRKVRML